MRATPAWAADRRVGPADLFDQVGLAVPTTYAELLAAPGNTQDHLASLLQRGQIQVDWDTSETVWRMSGQAYGAYARRRAKSGGGPPRRILADFLIGAHASTTADRLLARDRGFYRSYFAGLEVFDPSASS